MHHDATTIPFSENLLVNRDNALFPPPKNLDDVAPRKLGLLKALLLHGLLQDSSQFPLRAALQQPKNVVK